MKKFRAYVYYYPALDCLALFVSDGGWFWKNGQKFRSHQLKKLGFEAVGYFGFVEDIA